MSYDDDFSRAEARRLDAQREWIRLDDRRLDDRRYDTARHDRELDRRRLEDNRKQNEETFERARRALEEGDTDRALRLLNTMLDGTGGGRGTAGASHDPATRAKMEALAQEALRRQQQENDERVCQEMCARMVELRRQPLPANPFHPGVLKFVSFAPVHTAKLGEVVLSGKLQLQFFHFFEGTIEAHDRSGQTQLTQLGGKWSYDPGTQVLELRGWPGKIAGSLLGWLGGQAPWFSLRLQLVGGSQGEYAATHAGDVDFLLRLTFA